MTTTTGSTGTTDIVSFVNEVRTHLGDLRPDERDELLDGLEADLADQLADGAAWAGLGDPRSYAAELRLAAGLPEASRRRLRTPQVFGIAKALDRSRVRFDHAVGARAWSRGTWDVVRELRPVWWVARAWVLLTFIDVCVGPSEPISVVPSLGHPVVGPVVLAAAVVLSVLVGLGRFRLSGGPGPVLAHRVALLAVNAAAVVAPLTFAVPMPGYVSGAAPYNDGYDPYTAGFLDARSEARVEASRPGLRVGPKHVTNVFAYGSDGQPLTGVQLFDQDGQPLAVRNGASDVQGPDRRVPCPTLNGTTQLFNVYPLDQAQLRTGVCTPETPGRKPAPLPLTEVPPVATPTSGATTD